MNRKEVKFWDRAFKKYSKGEDMNIHGSGSYKEIKMLSGKVLDVGCGSMEYLSYVKRSQDNYLVGLDFSKNALKIAKKNAKNKNVALVRGAAEYLPFTENIFDNVLCIEVMHHLDSIDDCKQIIGEINRVSKLNALLTFHHKDYARSLEKLGENPTEEGKIFFDETDVSQILEKNGFHYDKKKIFTLGEMWQIPLYEIWPYYLPKPETKAVIQVECSKL